MSRKRIFILSGTAALVVLVGAVWFLFFRDTSPPAPTLEGAVADVTSTTAAVGEPTTTTSGSVEETTTTLPPATTAASGGIEGVWALSGDGTSYVGYRVQEELASIGAKTAVGRTPLVEASLEIHGEQVISVVVEADLTGLQSDDSRRDGQMRSQALETNTFPMAGFTLTAPIDLPAGAADGAPIEVTGTGELTLHGVTNPIEVPIEAQLVDGKIVIVASAPIVFADYQIDKPTSFAVLSVDDHGVMELLLVFEPAG